MAERPGTDAAAMAAGRRRVVCDAEGWQSATGNPDGSRARRFGLHGGDPIRGLPRGTGPLPRREVHVAGNAAALRFRDAALSCHPAACAGSARMRDSSTAPGARNIGASKEVTALKRRALERGASVNSNETVQSSYLNDMRAALNGDRQPAPRAAKRKAQETLGHIREENEEEPNRSRRAQQARKKVVVEREMKAGYCENCRDKFDDFDVVSVRTYLVVGKPY